VPKAKIRTVYERAEDVKDVADELIETMGLGLKDASIEYYARSRERDGVLEPARALDSRNWGKASCATPRQQQINKLHFVIEVNGNWWEHATPEQRFAGVYHLLLHCWLNEGRPRLVQHDFAGFAAEIIHYGPWSKDLHGLVDNVAQLQIPLEGATVPPDPAPAQATG
jgi:hypothetical protein